MSLRTAETSSEKCLRHCPSGRTAADESAEAGDVEVITLDTLVRGKCFMNQARANAWCIVGRDRGTYTNTANGHVAGDLAITNGTY